MATISVLLATYNGERFIAQQLDSLAAQTVLPTELVVVDDSSTDGTLTLIDQFAQKAPFPVVIYRNSQRRGYRKNFISAMALCRSDLIAFCDQDDYWDRDKLSVAAAAFDDPEVLLFFHSAWLVDDNNKRLGSANIFTCPGKVPALTHPSLTSPYGFSMVFRRELTQFTNLWSSSLHSGEAGQPMSHDQWIYFLASAFGTIIRSDRRLVAYRQHSGNTVGYNVKSSLRSRIGRLLLLFRNEEVPLTLLAMAAEARARVLGAAQTQLVGVWQERARLSELRYIQFATWLFLRADVYNVASSVRPTAIVARLFRERAYGTLNDRGLEFSSLYKDASCGIILRRFLLSPAKFEALRQRASVS